MWRRARLQCLISSGEAWPILLAPQSGMPLWGFGRPDQIGEGIHTRLRSRAFATAQADDPTTAARLCQRRAWQHRPPHCRWRLSSACSRASADTYTLDNVIISATHTHAGPSGYWHSRTDTGLDGGFYPAHFEAIVAGITASIVTAHEDLQPGNILINAGRL